MPASGGGTMVQAIWKAQAFENGDFEDDDQQEIQKDTRLCSKLGFHISHFLSVIWDRIPFRHLAPMLVLVLYTVFGGWLFRYLELRGANSNAMDQDMSTDNTSVIGILNSDSDDFLNSNLNETWVKDQLTQRLMRISMDHAMSVERRSNLTLEAWVWFDEKMKRIRGLNEPTLDTKWSMWNAMFYSATLYTTIGYGHIAPSTTAGRVATMIYAMIGIPMVLTILNGWGNLLFEFLKWIMRQYTKCKHRRSVWVPIADLPDGIDELPVSMAVFLLIFWIGICAGLFLIWEKDWTYFTSLYFFFISLTTIGLGDVVPQYPQYTLMCFILVLCGLSVVSMSFNIIQTKIENVFKSLMLGIEQEYWQKQVEPGQSQFGQEESGMNASVGVMQLWKKKPLRDRILFKLMDHSKKQMLHDYWEKKANTKNQATQTEAKKYVTSVIQVDMEEEELKTKYKNRKYVYNLHD